MAQFVVSVSNSDEELQGYYSSTTTADGLLVEELNAANIFTTKSEANTIAGRYQSLNPDSEVAVKKVEVSVKLV